MKKSRLLLVFLFSALLLTTANSVLAVEERSSETEKTETREQERKKTREEIEAHRAELRAEKAREIEAKKAELAKEREEKSAAREAAREEKETEREQKREERETEMQERVQEKLGKFVEVLTEKVEKYYSRLSQLSEKLQARIDELKERDIDTTEVQAKLDAADTLLVAAYEEALKIIASIKDADLSSKENLGEVVSQVKELKNPFRDALAAYKEVVQELRALVEENRPADSSEAKER